MVFRFRGIKVPAVKADLPVSVGTGPFITADIKGFCRKREEVLPVLFEKLGDHGPLFIVVFGRFLYMQVKECAIIFFDVMVRWHRNKQVPTGHSDFIFDILCECSDNMSYTHHFFIRTFCESKDYNYHMPHKTCG